MNLSKPLIVNSELFLSCAGNCSGCFLTPDERNSSNFFLDKIKDSINSIMSANAINSTHSIVGFGRGNILNLGLNDIDRFIEFMVQLNSNYNSEQITFEISTSLIGKIDSQISKALYILEKIDNAYFNVVINSEITSKNFWDNWKKFYNSNESFRKSHGFTDNFGDILVLNVNPKNLPNLDLIYSYIKGIKSPVNISLFPFTEEATVKDLVNLNDWAKEMFTRFSHLDLNIKNYLDSISEYDLENISFSDFNNFIKSNRDSYYFIDKYGSITSGSLSIMGEIDFPRLLEKFSLNKSDLNLMKKMQSDIVCSNCEFQRTCITSGAAYNKIANDKFFTNTNGECKSGYRSIFAFKGSNK